MNDFIEDYKGVGMITPSPSVGEDNLYVSVIMNGCTPVYMLNDKKQNLSWGHYDRWEPWGWCPKFFKTRGEAMMKLMELESSQ